MKQAFIYTRVSTARQVAEGESLGAQEQKAILWATANGYAIAGVFSDEGISGKKASNRPGLQAALTGACQRGNVLVFYSLTRLARSTRDAIEIAERVRKSGADLVSLTESFDTTTAAGRMFFGVLAILAQFEREITVERVMETLSFKAKKGERVGQVPYGWTLAADGVRLVADTTEAATLADLSALRATGMSWQQIADEMNRRGITTKTERPWTWQTTRKAATLKRLDRSAA